MRKKKKQKTIRDKSVSQLLDDFISPDSHDPTSSTKDIEDEEYIRMMLQKDEDRQQERIKRAALVTERVTPDTQSDTIDDDVRERFFPDMDERPVEKEMTPETREIQPEEKAVPPGNGIIEDIMDTIVVKDVSGLAAQMREAVEFVQDEMGTSDAERKLIEALERYKQSYEPVIKQLSNDNIHVLKRCQNCHYCAGKRNKNGSTWCLCSNLDRSTDVEIEDSWVKSGINLSCWKVPQD